MTIKRLTVNRFYEFNSECINGKYVCDEELSNGYVIKRIDSRFIRDYRGTFITGDLGRVKEIFKEHLPKTRDKELFSVALKIAMCGDIDSHMNGQESSTIQNYEGEHSIFSKFWAVPINEEKEWLENFDLNGGRQFGVSSDIWFEDHETIGDAILKIRMFKKYLSEV